MNVTYLTNDIDFIEICRNYWAIDDEGNFIKKVSEIGKEHSLSTYEVLKIIQCNCIAYSTTQFCKLCAEPYIYRSRSEYPSTLETLWTCQECITREQKKIHTERYDLILNKFLQTQIRNPLTISKLTMRQSILILALIRHSGSEDFSQIKEYEKNEIDILSPSRNFDLEIIQELYNEKLIAISPNSDPDSLLWNDYGNLEARLPDVQWLLPLNKECHPKEFIIKLEEKITSTKFIETEAEGLINLCRQVALHDCLAYLQHVMKEHGLYFSPGNKTFLVLEKILEIYSVSQAYCFIWSAAKTAASYYMRNPGIPKQQVANSVIGSIERIFERNVAKGWTPEGFDRNYYLPQSILSQIVYDYMLKIHDGSFNISISELNKLFFETHRTLN